MIMNSQEGLPVRKRLRHVTHHHHLRLNRHPLLAGLTQPDLSLANYRKLLVAYYHLYSALESRITRFLENQPGTFDYNERGKVPLLLNDLAFFHIDPLDLGSDMLRELDFPELERIGNLVGALYTIEGSTLGGQIISRSLAENHGLTEFAGACFFNGYGERTILMWEAFVRFADKISEHEDECRAAEQTACQTFQLFEIMVGKGNL